MSTISSLKTFKIQDFRNKKDIYCMVVLKELKEIKNDHEQAENDNRNKKFILLKLSLFKKSCSFFMQKIVK